MQAEYKALVQWLTQPFTTDMPMWKFIITFIVFVIIGFIVVDNLDLLKKGLQA